MLFSSITFIYYFLPLVLSLYFLVPKPMKNIVLLISSLVFYGWGEPGYVMLMMTSVIVSYIFGLLIERSRGRKISSILLIIGVSVSVSILFIFKYGDFFIHNINVFAFASIPMLGFALPLGISFYTFQGISYMVDVYRKEVHAQKNIIKLATYIAMFPQLIAGPIVRYTDIAYALDDRRHSFEKISYGTGRFLTGLAKKVLIANQLGELCELFKNSQDKAVLYFWLYAIAFSLHIYFDFSGYSDMAVGLGRIFGFEFVENFNYPYISKSITEFWRRWHISLGVWFMDYVYIPLGGNRRGGLRNTFNILVVWALTGAWHGAEWKFIVWGLIFAVFIMIEKLCIKKVPCKLLKKLSPIGHIYALTVVTIGFVVFNSQDVKEAYEYIRAMFGGTGYPIISKEFIYYLKSYAVILIVAIFGATPIPKYIAAHVSERFDVLADLLEIFLGCAALILVTAYLIDGSFNPFLYFRF